jgi:predicted GNAT family acetyltransferase
MIDKNTIIDFGIPDNLKNLNLKFCFDDILADKDIVGTGCHCKTDSTKFFLYYTVKSQCIFTMDFYVSDKSHSYLKISERRIHLQHIETNGAFRKQGIASFYIRRLIDFCINNNIRFITLDVCPFSKDTSNMLNKSELTKYYTNFSTDEVKIHII